MIILRRCQGLSHFAALFCALALLASCGDSADRRSDKDQSSAKDEAIAGDLVYRYSSSVKTLNPLLNLARDEQKIVRYHLNLPLLEKNPDTLEFVPWLAQALPEISADGMRQTWELRKEARWSNGKPVTSADIVATWNLINSQGFLTATGTLRDSIGPVSSVKALDDLKFEVQLHESDMLAAYRFGLNFAAIPKAAIPENARDILSQESLPGTGPYRLKELSIDLCDLERIEPWWGDQVEVLKGRWRIKNFRYKTVLETVPAVEQLKKGTIDFFVGDITEYKSLMAKADEYQINGTHYYLSSLFSSIGFNCRRAPFDDARVRRALAYAIPRPKINELHIGGLARPLSGPFALGSPYNAKDVENYEYRPLKAKALLKEAGFEDSDGDGVLDRNGKPFRFTLTRTTAGRIWSDGIVNLSRESLAQIGVVMEVEDLERGAAYARYAQLKHDAYAEVWDVDVMLPQLDVYTLFHSSQISQTGYNWQAYSNTKLDELLLEFAKTRDEGRRVTAGQAIHRILHDEQPMIFLFNNPTCVIWNRRIAGVVAHPLGVLPWDFKIAN